MTDSFFYCTVLPKISTLVLLSTVATAAAAKSLQSCPTLCDPTDSSPPGSPSLGFSRQEHWSGLPFPSALVTYNSITALVQMRTLPLQKILLDSAG